jgi:hypothetical protein
MIWANVGLRNDEDGRSRESSNKVGRKTGIFNAQKEPGVGISCRR